MKKSIMRKSSVLLIFSIFVLAVSGNVIGMSGYPLPPELKPTVFDDSTVSKSLPVTWNSWKAGQTYTKTIGSGFLINKISFEVAEKSEGIVVVSVDKLEDIPESISNPSGQIYGSGQISYNKFATASETTIYFTVEKEWLSANNLNADSISVMGYDSEASAWTPFETEIISEEPMSYSATITPDIQIYSVVASSQGNAGAVEQIIEETEQEVMEKPDSMEKPEEVMEKPEEVMEKPEAPAIEAEVVVDGPSAEPEGNNSTVVVLILVILIIAGAGLFYYKKKKSS